MELGGNMVNILIENTNIGQDNKVRIGCRLLSDEIEGNMIVTASRDEYQEAFNNDTVNQLVKLKFAAIDEVAKKALNEQLTELTKENEALKQQMNMSNLSTLMMINELEKKIPKLEESPEVEEKPTEETNEDNNIDN